MIRASAILTLCLSVTFVLAKDDYKLGPDAMEQPDVPKGETYTFKWDSKVFDGTTREVPVASMTDDKGATTSRDGLMASPSRLIVPVNGRQGTRLLYMGPRDKERYFRVRFIPVVPEKDDNFGITEEDRADYKDHLAAGINVMAGYGTVFFVRPKDTRFDTQISDTTDQYQLRNAGNSTVVLDEFHDCSVTDATDCVPTTKHHILPERQLKFEKKPGRRYSFVLVEGLDKKPMKVEKSNG